MHEEAPIIDKETRNLVLLQLNASERGRRLTPALEALVDERLRGLEARRLLSNQTAQPSDHQEKKD